MSQKLNDYFDEIAEALSSINGKLGVVKIANVFDAEEVRRAVAEVEDIVDSRLSQLRHNPTVAQSADTMKAAYRHKILDAVEAQKAKVTRPPGTPPLFPSDSAPPALDAPPAGDGIRSKPEPLFPRVAACSTGFPTPKFRFQCFKVGPK